MAPWTTDPIRMLHCISESCVSRCNWQLTSTATLHHKAEIFTICYLLEKLIIFWYFDIVFLCFFCLFFFLMELIYFFSNLVCRLFYVIPADFLYRSLDWHYAKMAINLITVYVDLNWLYYHRSRDKILLKHPFKLALLSSLPWQNSLERSLLNWLFYPRSRDKILSNYPI